MTRLGILVIGVRWRCCVLCGVWLACLAMLVLAAQSRAASYSPDDAFYWSLPGAAAIAVSPDGNFVYVANSSLKRIEEFDSDGVLARNWIYNKHLQAPSSVTTDDFGNVYVLYPHEEEIVKYTADGKKVLASWNVPFARAIAASRGGRLYVLTNFLNAVGVYNSEGTSIGGFVANLPGQWFPNTSFSGYLWPQSGYDAPYKTVATEIAVDASGNPIVVGDSVQALSNPEPDCSEEDSFQHIDTHPYPDPLVSGEAARFTPAGTPIAYGWLSESQQSCYAGIWQVVPGRFAAYGWQNSGTNPGAVAADPNGGDVYATSGDELGAIHLRSDLGNTTINVNAPSYSCFSIDCTARDWDLIAGNPPTGVALDCHSNLYMLSPAGFVAKFIDQDPVPPGSCVTPNRFSEAPPPTLAVLKFHIGKIGKEKVLAGCSGKLCGGTLSLRSSSPLCRSCTLSRPHHFRIGPGLRRTISLQLTGLGRRLLLTDPGLPIKVLGRLTGGRTFAQQEALRQPTTLGARCAFPGSSGGVATVSGTLAPADGGKRITIQYLPPQSAGLLIPAVQRTVRANRTGDFHDSYSLNGAGKWIIAASWAGDRTQEPAAARPCSGAVQQIPTRITLTCPTGSSAGAPSPFSGGLSGAAAGAAVALDYEAPPGVDASHDVVAGDAGQFSDSFSPTEPGAWLALAHYKGDAGHAPAEAACQFTVAPADFSIAATPTSGSVQQGASVSATVNTAVTSGTPQALSLSASGGPGAVTFSPASITAGSSSTVTFKAAADATPGAYSISLTAAGGWATHATTYMLTVLAPSTVTLECAANANRQSISCSGALTSGGVGIGGAQIMLTYQPPAGGGSSTVDLTHTAADGTYSDTLNAPVGSLLAPGSWHVQAQFGGDGTHAPASESQTVVVP